MGLKLWTPPPLYNSDGFLVLGSCHPFFLWSQEPCLTVCWCPFLLCRCAGTMPKSLCGCGVSVGSSEQAKREHLKSAKHKQWVQGTNRQRPLNFPKLTPVQPTEASAASSSSCSSNSSAQSNKCSTEWQFCTEQQSCTECKFCTEQQPARQHPCVPCILMIFFLLCVSLFGAGMPNPGERLGFNLIYKNCTPQNYKSEGGGGVWVGQKSGGWVQSWRGGSKIPPLSYKRSLLTAIPQCKQ